MTLESRLAQAERRTPPPARRPDVPAPKNLLDFTVNPGFLGIDLYPLQGLIVKIATGAVDLLTEFDLERIAEWEDGWHLTEHRGRLHYQGREGTPPGLLRRLELCREQGRPGPVEVAMVLGRRAGKGLLSSILMADLLYRLIQSDGITQDVQPRKGKTITVLVMGAKLDQAKRNAFADIRDLLENTAAFRPFLGRSTTESVSLLLPSQLEEGALVGRTQGRLEVRAVETTPRAARGPTVIGFVTDEFGHVGNDNNIDASTSSVGIYRSLRPSTAQFPRTSLVLQTSSPWEKIGQLYQSYQMACEVDPDTGDPKFPGVITVQLPSWKTYEHWAEASTIPMWPGGPTYPEQQGPIIERHGLLDLFEEMDPDGFDVEYGAQFASVVNRYLNPRIMAKLTGPDANDVLPQVDRVGAGNRTYIAHGDPARVGDTFGFAIGHVRYDENGLPHVYIDDAFGWRPRDFADGIIHYPSVEAEITDILARYPTSTMTFDHYNSFGTIDRLQAFVASGGAKHRTNVYVREAGYSVNWKMAEVFKAAAMAGLVHIPAELTDVLEELDHLQVTGQRVDHPTTGAVTSKDLADCVINIVYSAIGANWDATFQLLGSLRLHAHPGIVGNTVRPPLPSQPMMGIIEVLTQDEMWDRLGGGSGGSGHGAARGAGYNPARGDRRGRGRH